MAAFRLDRALMILERTPDVLEAMLRGLPEDWTHENEGKDSWSPFDVVGHLLHGERTDWIPRLRSILEEGGERPFEPFDRFAQLEENRGRPLRDLLRAFRRKRRENLRVLRGYDLEPPDLDRPGLHPELGPVTLRQLLATWVAHDLGHIRQIARVMAKQYRDEIGPWRDYMPVMSE